MNLHRRVEQLEAEAAATAPAGETVEICIPDNGRDPDLRPGCYPAGPGTVLVLYETGRGGAAPGVRP